MPFERREANVFVCFTLGSRFIKPLRKMMSADTKQVALGVKVQQVAVVMTDECIERASGYKTVLHRGLGAIANFAFGFTEVAVLASFTSSYTSSLALCGPATLVWS